MAKSDIEPETAEKTAHFGFTTIDRDEKQERVDEVFSRVAKRYDLMNDLMSGGLHRLWKDAVIDWMAPSAKGAFQLLDVAGGTGDIAFRFAARTETSATATVLDINPGMLAVGEKRAAQKGLEERVSFVDGNAETLPFSDRQFDAYTVAFGIRNVPDIPKALKEAFRVLKPGGRFLCLEFSRVDVPMLDTIYDTYSFRAIPAMGRLVAGDADSYRYLVESIRMFPDQETFRTMIADAGFRRVSYRNLTGGIAAIHSGWRL